MSESPTGAGVSTKPPEYAKSLSFEDVRALLVDAIGIEPPEGAPSRWWVDEAVRMVLRYRQREEGRTLYDVSTVGARMVCTALMVESTLVPLLSLYHFTPSSSRTSSMRCSTPLKVRSAWRMTAVGTPEA